MKSGTNLGYFTKHMELETAAQALQQAGFTSVDYTSDLVNFQWAKVEDDLEL